MAQYLYSVWALMFLVVWTVLYLIRKDLRREMLWISAFFGFAGVASQMTYTVDWWQPITLTHTRIGIEDFIIGFCIGGVAAVIYEEIYRTHLRSMSSKNRPYPYPAMYLLGFAALFLMLFYGAGLTSLYSTYLAYLISLLFLYWRRQDLVYNSFISAVAMLVIGIGMYLLLFLVHPDYIREFWYLRPSWYAELVLGIPVGEYVFFFLTGAFIGPLYEFLKKSKNV